MSFRTSLFFLSLFYFIYITKCQSETQFFRKDYKYLDATRAFYKIHTLHRTWQEAREKCEAETAQLFYPADEDEASAVIAYWNETQPFPHVFVGISSPNVKEVFESVDGVSISNIYNMWGPGEPNNAGGVEECVVIRRDGTLNDDSCKKSYPFICKKNIETLEWNTLCNLPYLEYEFNPKRGRCYKFHLKPMNWTDAYKACDTEQSYLAVINDQEEADILVNLTAKTPKDNVEGSFLSGAVHLGFRKKEGEKQWRTIKGAPLERAGYARWSPNQPDGGDKELCGSMFYDGKLNDIACDVRMFFICEHEIEWLSTAIVLRFSEVFKPKPNMTEI